MQRHIRESYFVVGEGTLTRDDNRQPVCYRPSTEAELREFRFSRMGPKGKPVDDDLLKALADAMTPAGRQPNSSSPPIPAGFTYLGQFIDHDLTRDNTGSSLNDRVTVAELIQGRSPALDLDSVYGRGPQHPEDKKFYGPDGVRLLMGTTAATPFPDGGTNVDLNGFDLPRVGFGDKKSERRAALIPDARNDENLAIAQVHLAFIRFHNRVVDKLAREGTPASDLFAKARRVVVRHYQWLIRHDFLPRIVDKAILDDVFKNGRKFFEVKPKPQEKHHLFSWMYTQAKDTPTMPIEFSVAAYRLGHSMIRGAYQWNRVFNSGGPGGIATLALLFRFSGTSGILSPPPADLNDGEAGDFERLPTNWIADFRRLFDFGEAGRSDLVVPASDFNLTQAIDTLLVNPLRDLPLGAFGGRGTTPPAIELNLAFRNLARANTVSLASGQDMAKLMGVEPLSAAQILDGMGGVSLAALTQAQKDALTANTPLWFYILREAEFNGGRLTGVGGRIVAEVFHRTMEDSTISIVREPHWKPYLGPDANTFRMVDLLLFAFEGKAELLNPLGNAPTA